MRSSANCQINFVLVCVVLMICGAFRARYKLVLKTHPQTHLRDLVGGNNEEED